MGIIIPILITLLLLGVGSYFAYQNYLSSKEVQSQQDNQQLIGGDTDEHGCLIIAGYSWCEIKQKCLRVWEEPCQFKN